MANLIADAPFVITISLNMELMVGMNPADSGHGGIKSTDDDFLLDTAPYLRILIS